MPFAVQFEPGAGSPQFDQNLGIINAKDFGAVGNGVADDTAAIQAALNAWVVASTDTAKAGSVLLIPPGQYKTTALLTATFTQNTTQTKLISAYGARLLPTIASGHVFEVGYTGAAQARNLTIAGLMIDGTGATDAAAALLHLAGGTTGDLYRMRIVDVALETFVGHGCLIDGNAFESTVEAPHFIAAAGNQTGNCLFVQNSGGVVSSIDVIGGSMTGGLHNIYCITPQGGIKVYGGTYLTAFNDAILFDNGTEGSVMGSHVENAWQGGIASPSWTTSQSGVTLTGRGFTYNVYGTCNNSKMRYVVKVFAAPMAGIFGGMAAGQVDYYLRATAAAGGQIVTAGIGSGATGTIHDGTPATAKTTRLGNAGTIAVQIDKGAIQTSQGAPVYSASITLDAATGSWQRITVTDGVAFTINAPSNPPDATHAADLTLEILNSSGGVMGAVTFNPVFIFDLTQAWANPASTKKRQATFGWNGSAWVCISISNADY